jgi:hypothetical protein
MIQLNIQQSNAWKSQIEILKETIFTRFSGKIYFEFIFQEWAKELIIY